MKKLIIWQSLLTLLVSAGLFLWSTQAAISFASGGALVTLNFLILGWAWSLIFQKKLVALAVSLIVFKYAILGIIIYKLIVEYWVDALWFTLGVSSFVLSCVIYVFANAVNRAN